MAVAVAKVSPNADTTFGNKKIKIRTLTFSSNYATGGEALAASDFGLKKIQHISFGGVASSSDVATACAVSYDYTNGKVVFYESGAANAALAEKTNAEAYPTGCNVRVLVVGY